MEFTKDLLSSYKNLITSGADIHSDLSVEVEDESFPCHKFVLAACSPFFRTLFQWDKQEDKRNSVHLEDISSETFKLIYIFIYHHENALNEENFLDVWKAADFLQIEFIVSACEKLAMETINERNCHRYFWHAKLLGKNVMAKILEYITFNFDQFKDREYIMELGAAEMLTIVRNSSLISSREENVVDTVLKWVSHSFSNTSSPGNKRVEYLVPLLSVLRMTSLSEDYLKRLLSHQLIPHNVIALNLIIKVLLYKMGCRPTYWPNFACQRKSSKWDDVVLMQGAIRNIDIFSLTERKIIGSLDTADLPQDAILNVHVTKIFACGYTDTRQNSLTVSLFEQVMWRNVANVNLGDGINRQEWDLPSGQQSFISFSIRESVHIVHTRSGNIFTWDPKNDSDLGLLTSVPSEMPIIHVTPFNFSIIVISGDSNNPVMLNIYDTARQEWESTVFLECIFDQNISTFQKEDKLYLLTSRGEIYDVDIKMGGVTLSHVATLANFNCSMIGALLYFEELYVFVRAGTCNIFHETYPKFPELFNQVHVIGTLNPCSSLIPMSMHKFDTNSNLNNGS